MELIVAGDGTARWGGRILRCALGRAGISNDKREGDGATPAGIWPIREVLFRADRVALATGLPHAPLKPDDGWCDDPADRNYNRLIKLPSKRSAEGLKRGDHLYDLVLVLGYNDRPRVRGRGSAIFVHLARPGYTPTEGCIALSLRDLSALIRQAWHRSALVVMR